jgi:hypothetical protein
MLFSRPMQNLHVELGQFFQLAIWTFKSHEPSEAVVVGTNEELPA